MDNRYILITVSVLTIVSSSYGSQVITTLFGKNATLPCQIANQGSDLQFFYWRKDGTIIYSRKSKRGNGKYSVTATASLVIPDVMESDAGSYSCIVVRKSFTTEESEIMQLYAIDVSVSHCKDTGQEMDGCSCNINGSNIASLQCSASGFPHPPVVTWEEKDRIIYLSSSVDLTRFSENITLTCKAKDENLKGVVANKTVCVYFAREVTSTDGSQVETTTASVNDRAHVAVIVLSIVLILLVWLICCLAAAYKRKKGKAFRFPTSIMCTSMPKRLEEPDEPPLRGKDIDVNDAECGDVLKDNWKNSKESSLGDLSTSQPVITSIEGESGDVDFFPKDCNQNVVGDEQHLPVVGHANMTSPTTSSIVETTDLERNAALSNAISQIMQSLPMPENMASPMTSSMALWNHLPSVLRGELQSPERTATCNNAFSQINQDFLETWYSGLRGNICSNCGTAMLLSSVSDPVVQTSAEEDGIPDTPSSAKLLEEKCRDKRRV